MDSPVWCISQYVSADGAVGGWSFYLCKDSSLVRLNGIAQLWGRSKKERESVGKRLSSADSRHLRRDKEMQENPHFAEFV
jgi:hypothetical protein